MDELTSEITAPVCVAHRQTAEVSFMVRGVTAAISLVAGEKERLSTRLCSLYRLHAPTCRRACDLCRPAPSFVAKAPAEECGDDAAIHESEAAGWPTTYGDVR